MCTPNLRVHNNLCNNNFSTDRHPTEGVNVKYSDLGVLLSMGTTSLCIYWFVIQLIFKLLGQVTTFSDHMASFVIHKYPKTYCKYIFLELLYSYYEIFTVSIFLQILFHFALVQFSWIPSLHTYVNWSTFEFMPKAGFLNQGMLPGNKTVILSYFKEAKFLFLQDISCF